MKANSIKDLSAKAQAEPDLKDHIDRVRQGTGGRVGIELFSRWKECKLGDISIYVNRGVSPSYVDGDGLQILNQKCIRNGRIDFNQAKQTLAEKKYTIEKRLIQNDILINSTGVGTAGRVGRFLSNELCYADTHVSIVRIDKKLADPNYVFYNLNSREDEIENYAEGSTGQIELGRERIKAIDILLPPFSDQTAIASILSSLDDKIDLLHRQNKTLEQLAETLFRSYFSMTNEEINYVELGNYVECINGVSYKSSELNPSKVGMVSLKSFDRNGGFSIEGFKEFTGKYKEKQVVVEGDLIVAHTDITQDAEVIGNPALVISNPNFDTMIISMDIVKVISKVDWISIEFLYFLMRTREFKSHCEGCANGSTVLHLNKQAIPTFEFPEPDKNKVADFTKQAKEIVNKIFLNHRQLRNLVKTRDTLLPKLMNGEVRVNL